MIEVRDFRLGDEPALRVVFESAIHEVARCDYSQLQVVSLTAQPFFAHFGFAVVEHRVLLVRGVEMRNAAMRKALG